MLEKKIKLFDMTIHEGSHLLKENPNCTVDVELAGNSSGVAYPRNSLDIFPVNGRDVVYLYHTDSKRIRDLAEGENAEILGYLISIQMELNDHRILNFDELNTRESIEPNTALMQINCIHLKYELIPDQDKREVAVACPVRPLPQSYF